MNTCANARTRQSAYTSMGMTLSVGLAGRAAASFSFSDFSDLGGSSGFDWFSCFADFPDCLVWVSRRREADREGVFCLNLLYSACNGEREKSSG